MKIELVDIIDVIPYEKNPRKNSGAVETVKASIREFGFKQPIVVDKDMIIVVGHTRYRAAEELGYSQVPVLIANDLTEEQCRAYRIMDNKSNEIAEWDEALLIEELRSLENYDLALTGFSEKEISELFEDDETIYNRRVDSPIYTPKGTRPALTSLTDLTRFRELTDSIRRSDISDEEREFLLLAAHRHVAFDYELCAEYYAHASEQTQRLMEDSALVIIDFRRAIELGYVRLNDEMRSAYLDEYEGGTSE